MFRKATLLRHLQNHFGLKWLVYRTQYALRQKIGLLSWQYPVQRWVETPLSSHLTEPNLAEPAAYRSYRLQNAPRFFFISSDRTVFQPYFETWDRENSGCLLSQMVTEFSQGTLTYFSHHKLSTRFPFDWHTNPFENLTAPCGKHWSRLGDFKFGDIKLIWEANRFGFVYSLVRAYWRTDDDAIAELFWQTIEDWRLHNPPQQGANWKCGQETTFRVMAWCFGLYGFLNSPASTAQRVSQLGQMIAVSGARIKANLVYALSQKNNHSISEAVGLWTIALLFPELKNSAKWRKTSYKLLEQLGQELIYDDGSFVQHSVNYHRVMLHDYLWAIQLGELHQQPFSDALKTRVRKAGEWLYQIQDEQTGRVPYYGQNDGALILPLSHCDYQDFRPAVQATHYLTTGERCYKSGPWDEDLLWLFGPQSLTATERSRSRTDWSAQTGGYYTVRGADSHIFVRNATFKHRPSQADMLHTDLWWRGQNIAIDAGTYSYNAPTPWNNPLASTAYHNTVMVDDLDQMERKGKFLWLPWLTSQVNYQSTSPQGQLSYWEGMHNGYQRLPAPVQHRRGIVRIGNESWLVLDQLNSLSVHDYRLHWLFPDVPYHWEIQASRLVLDTSAGKFSVQILALSDSDVTSDFSLVRADADSSRGWRSFYYYQRSPALSLANTVKTDRVLFVSLFSPTSLQSVLSDVHATSEITVTTEDWHSQFVIGSTVNSSIITSATVSGLLDDTLNISS